MWTWPQVWRSRLQRHWLLRPAPLDRVLDVVGDVCGIHAQLTTSAELSLGLRVAGLTRQHVRTALWQDRSLVKTYALRGTLHLLPTRELGLWLSALRAKVPPHAPAPAEREAVPPERRQALVMAIHAALEAGPLTRDELHVEMQRRLGDWATAATFPAFGGHWPRWQLALRQAALDGLIVFGPNRGNRVSYVRTDEWLGALDVVDGQAALREVCLRFLQAYGPATHLEFARWFATSRLAARELMQSLDLVEIEVEGWRGWLPRGAQDAPGMASEGGSVLLLPQYDCYVVGGFPRDQLIPAQAPEPLRRGTAAPFAVVLIDGVIGGLWERRVRGTRLDVRVDAFSSLSKQQQREIELQAARIGETLELHTEVSFGSVEARGHL
ncbi:MAG TPA: winged helix DNA-binding domain-containing protein [Chloroflexota bacterium]